MINTMTEENTIVKLPFANGNHPRTEAQKQVIIDQASAAYEVYMDALGFDWRSDPNSADTPMRVAKAFVNDLVLVVMINRLRLPHLIISITMTV